MTAKDRPLARAAALVAGSRPDWRDAETFYQRRSEAIAAIRAVAADRCDRCEAVAPRERLARAHALLRHAAAELARHRRLLASARPKPRRRRAGPDPRQAVLPLAEGLTP
jgi:hypothetical protein